MKRLTIATILLGVLLTAGCFHSIYFKIGFEVEYPQPDSVFVTDTLYVAP